MLRCRSSFIVNEQHDIFLSSCSSHWTTQDHGERSVNHPQYPFPSNATIPSLDDRTVLTTIITWNTQYPSGKLQRDRGISLFPLCHCSAPKHCQRWFKRNDRLRNITRSNCNLHVIFLSVVCPLENSCAFSSQWNNKGKKRQATDFSFVITKAGLFPLLSCTELVLRLLLRPHQHDKDNWKNAALFYKG